MEFLNILQSELQSGFIYIPNRGNAGDVVIQQSTIKFFEKNNLNFELGKNTTTYVGENLVYGGGGNLIGKYQPAKKFIKLNAEKNHIMILPHTIKNSEKSLNMLNKDSIVFCRERISHEYVSKFIEKCYLHKDMAFHLDLESYKKESKYEVGNIFRMDVESSNNVKKIPSNNVDISSVFNRRNQHTNLEVAQAVFDDFVNYIADFEIVNTDRLHIAIIAAILGKNVNLYPNSYYKNKAVYDYTLSLEYPNVNFIDEVKYR